MRKSLCLYIDHIHAYHRKVEQWPYMKLESFLIANPSKLYPLSMKAYDTAAFELPQSSMCSLYYKQRNVAAIDHAHTNYGFIKFVIMTTGCVYALLIRCSKLSKEISRSSLYDASQCMVSSLPLLKERVCAWTQSHRIYYVTPSRGSCAVRVDWGR